MRNLSSNWRVLVAAAFSLFAFTNLASAKEIISCRSQAEAAANEWADGRIYPAEPADVANPGQIVVISYGEKYIVPRPPTDQVRVITQGLGGLASDRNHVYEEELARCLEPYRTTINIFIE